MDNNDKIIALNIRALRANSRKKERFICEDHADRELVAYTTRAMRSKLSSGREKGRSGWWREDECTPQHLQNLLDFALADGDMISVINYAAMIHVRELADEE